MIFAWFLGQSDGWRVNNNTSRDEGGEHSFDKFFEYIDAVRVHLLLLDTLR